MDVSECGLSSRMFTIAHMPKKNKPDLCFVPQAKAVLKFIEAISEKTLRTTVALTAARGRGKSAALGLAMAAAVAFG